MRPAALRPAARAVRSARCASSSSGQRGRRGGRVIGLLAFATVCGAAVYSYPLIFRKEEAAIPPADIEFEKPRKAPASKEENRDLISSQHLQVKKSWENPGVYAWGSNAGRVVAPDSTDTFVKTPRRIPFFDGQLLRDIKLDRDFGVAVTEAGDLIQWGVAFSKTTTRPVATLTGKDIVKVAISADRVLALSSGGSVYSLPVSQADQQGGVRQRESSWIPFWSAPSAISYRTLQPANLGWNERVVDISSGLEHCLLLTSKGRVYSAASSTTSFPARSQLGIPGLTWSTRPAGPFDQPHEIMALRAVSVAEIATGDYHSLALDKDGQVFCFGDNSTGQLGFPVDPQSPYIETPSPLSFAKVYSGTGLLPKVTSIAAGGANSYFAVDAARAGVAGISGTLAEPVAEVWAAGEGLYGSLGTGKWTHISSGPTKIRALSNLSEYDEKTNKIVPIRLARLSVGSTHASAVLDNLTHVTASGGSSENDTNWGSDIVFWGGNEFYQLGTSKRNNANEPTYIAPLDGGEGDKARGREGEMYRFQITPRKTVRLGEGGKGRKVSVEQRVECGRYVTAVYSGT